VNEIRRLELAVRRGELTATIAMQRQHLAARLEPVEVVCGAFDRAASGANWIRRHPGVVGAALALLVITRPKRAVRWARRAFFLWRGWKGLLASVTG